MTGNRFSLYEKVRITSENAAIAPVRGELAAVLGMAQDGAGRWSYGVFVYRTGIVWSCQEEELAPTGDFDERASFYDGSSIRVSPHGEILA